MNSQVHDSSFQIPFGLDSTSNDLLLEGNDTLRNDFFGGGADFTMSTPFVDRSSPTKRGLRTRTPRHHRPLVESTVREEDIIEENEQSDEGAAELNV